MFNFGSTQKVPFMKRIITTAILIFCFQSIFGQVTVGPYGKGLQFTAKDSSYYLKIAGRMQLRYDGAASEGSDKWVDEAYIRRARLKFQGFAFDPKFEYYIQLSLSNDDLGGGGTAATGNSPRLIRDAVVKWHFAKSWEFWFGIEKVPGNRQMLISSQYFQFVERSLAHSVFTLNRDQGVQLRHTFNLGTMIVKEMYAVSIGDGSNITIGNEGGYDYAGRLEFLPFGQFKNDGDYKEGDYDREETPKLSLGIAYNVNDRSIRTSGNSGSYMTDASGNFLKNTLNTIYLDGIFKYQGISLQAEYTNREGSNNAIVSSAGQLYKTGTTFFAQVGYIPNKKFGFAGRFATSEPDDATFSGVVPVDEYTLGFTRYIAGHYLKLATDVSYLDYENTNDKFVARVMLEISY